MSRTVYPQLILKRIKKDLTDLEKEPILNAAARPCSDDLTLWDGVIEVQLTNITQRDNDKHRQSEVRATTTEKVKLHFNIEFPTDYPQSAPNIGFTQHFPYAIGASYTEKSGRLNGKMGICMDLLGNYSKVHTEWKNKVGSGWTPAYSVSSLLINLQSILPEELDSLNSHDKKKLFEQTEKFRKQSPGSFPPTATEEDVRLASLIAKLSPKLQKLVHTLEISDSYTKIKALIDYLEPVESNVPSGSESADKIDKNIVCYATGVDYTEDILGFGISIVRQGRQVNLSTPAELLSKTAFDNGMRKSSNKTPFEFFIPAFINPTHSSQNQAWKKVLTTSLQQIGMKGYQKTDLSACAYEIFPRLINTLVLEMMKCPDDVTNIEPEWDDRLPYDVNMKRINEFKNQAEADEARMSKSPSIAYFEAICSFWRTYYWLNEELLKSNLGKDAPVVVNNFAADHGARSKGACADIGGLLASYTAIQHRTDCTREQFIDAYLDECFLRCVMWWKKEGDETNNRRLIEGKRTEVFEATATSRNLTLFQIYFLKYIIGEKPTETASVMDSTNGKAPELLENFHKEWKNTKDKIIDWQSFFERTGCSKEYRDMVTTDAQKWINECVERCYKRGQAYVYKSRKSKHHERDDKYSDRYEREKKYYRY